MRISNLTFLCQLCVLPEPQQLFRSRAAKVDVPCRSWFSCRSEFCSKMARLLLILRLQKSTKKVQKLYFWQKKMPFPKSDQFLLCFLHGFANRTSVVLKCIFLSALTTTNFFFNFFIFFLYCEKKKWFQQKVLRLAIFVAASPTSRFLTESTFPLVFGTSKLPTEKVVGL